jgi:superfamily I DNA/RNA helicase
MVVCTRDWARSKHIRERISNACISSHWLLAQLIDLAHLERGAVLSLSVVAQLTHGSKVRDHLDCITFHRLANRLLKQKASRCESSAAVTMVQLQDLVECSFRNLFKLRGKH